MFLQNLKYFAGRVTIPLGTKDLATQNSPRHHMHRVVLRKDKVDLYHEKVVGQTLPFGIQMAVTEYRVLSSCGQRCGLVEASTATGFKHQVRVHLADALLCPVVGDYKFGGPLFRAVPNLKRKLKNMKLIKRSPMCLHAYQLCIPDYHRDGKPLVIKAPPPASFRQVARQLMLNIPK
ncbi:Mitochondrial RNA pseudouridine synthase Rpusd4 [Geodia barretti]|uniref:Mitochondrial RNA pseudouridine synthase Rpusd4 n=1 Tax=Geodia barretti TaxID=519541 RepID=A0AA35W4I3_GEOBA|nr:Mitochondrial RNA pseudouridine synthase Rpusd4 [Geodia barretti]